MDACRCNPELSGATIGTFRAVSRDAVWSGVLVVAEEEEEAWVDLAMGVGVVVGGCEGKETYPGIRDA